MNFSIRTRSIVYFSSLVGLLLVVFSLVLTIAVSESLERDFRLRMLRDGDILAELFKEEMRLDALDEFREEASELGLNIRIIDHEGRVFFQSRMWSQRAIGTASPPLGPDDPEQWSLVTVQDMPHIILSQSVVIKPHPPFILQLAEPKGPILAARRKIYRWSALLIPAMIALSILAGFLFSKSALAPVDMLRRRADALSPEDLSARIPYPRTKDELYYLTDTLNRALNRIEEAFSKMKAFTADASHELRIPLTALRGTVELALRRERTPEQYREAFQEALEEAERLSRITSDFLALARADAGEKAVNKAPVPIKPFVERIVEEFKNSVGPLGNSIVIEKVPDATVSLDPDQIQRILLNLLDNGVKYGGPGGKVGITAEIVDKRFRLAVRDSGPRIGPEHRDRIFDRFYRIDKTRSREQGGSGLGLAIASAIAKAHGGTLRLKNEAAAGNEFELLVPLENFNPALKTL